jgi:ribosomal protein L29
MKKKSTTTKKTDFTSKSRTELNELLVSYRGQLADLAMSLNGTKPGEKQAVKKNIARVLTTLALQDNS